MGVGTMRRDFDRCRDKFDRLLVVARFMVDEAQQVQRIELSRVVGQDLAIELFCFVQVARLMMRDRVFKDVQGHV